MKICQLRLGRFDVKGDRFNVKDGRFDITQGAKCSLTENKVLFSRPVGRMAVKSLVAPDKTDERLKHFSAKVQAEATEACAAFRQRKLHIIVAKKFTALRKML